MSIFQIIKGIFILPILWIQIQFRKDDINENYYYIQKKSQFLLSYLGYDLEVVGVDNIPQQGPVYFVCNHQGTLDPALVVASCPLPMAFISKKENEKMFIFGKAATSIGTIHFDRESREGNIFMLRESARRLKEKKSLLIFPEGTRSKQSKMNEFKAGALKPAYLAKATIIPITLNNAFCIDNRKDKNRKLKITYGTKIHYEEYKNITQEDLSNLLFKKIEKEIGNN